MNESNTIYEKIRNLFESNKVEQAIDALNPLLDEGDVDALILLISYCDYEDLGMVWSEIESFLRDAAEEGHAGALHYLGSCYELLDPSKEELSAEQIKMLKHAAESGHAEALHLLGQCYLSGTSHCKKDLKQAKVCWLKAAEAGHGEAQWDVGLAFLDGEGGPADIKQAVYWFEKNLEQDEPEVRSAEALYHIYSGDESFVEEAVAGQLKDYVNPARAEEMKKLQKEMEHQYEKEMDPALLRMNRARQEEIERRSKGASIEEALAIEEDVTKEMLKRYEKGEFKK